MQISEIETALQAQFPDAVIELAAEGNHLHVSIVSEQFDGLSTVKRQQVVYGALNDFIASGEVHAVHMKTFTPLENA